MENKMKWKFYAIIVDATTRDLEMEEEEEDKITIHHHCHIIRGT